MPVVPGLALSPIPLAGFTLLMTVILAFATAFIGRIAGGAWRFYHRPCAVCVASGAATAGAGGAGGVDRAVPPAVGAVQPWGIGVFDVDYRKLCGRAASVRRLGQILRRVFHGPVCHRPWHGASVFCHWPYPDGDPTIMTYDVTAIRADFPILSRQVNGRDLVYLDNGASAQKPQVVIDAVNRAYAHEYANVHRGLHYLSNLATDQYEAVRGKVARFLNAPSQDEIIFNTGTTEGINMVAYGWAMQNLQAGDQIVLSVMEHHANIVPWDFLRTRMGVELVWVDVGSDGDLPAQAVLNAITDKTKLIAITHMSNVLGTVVDVKAICDGAGGDPSVGGWITGGGAWPCGCPRYRL